MDNNRTNIERIVMQRVHLIRALRLVVSTSVVSTLVSLLALWGIGREVWVAHVLQNTPADLVRIPQFYLAAFIHTRLVVQVLALSALAALFFAAREISRALAFMKSTESS
ncbi:MAG: hypothetical protein WC217_01145 [Candidatus Paceibacterota bacterium]|jgi:hypothetical protein